MRKANPNSNKPTFVLFRTSDLTAINLEDLKVVTTHKTSGTLIVATSTGVTDYPDEKINKKAMVSAIKENYNVATLDKEIQFDRNSSPKPRRLVVHVIQGESDIWIWPRGLSTIRIEDNQVFLGLHGQTDELVHELESVPSSSSGAELLRLAQAF